MAARIKQIKPLLSGQWLSIFRTPSLGFRALVFLKQVKLEKPYFK
jgi:hypothetical protein